MVKLKVRVFVLVLSILVVCMGNALAMQFYQPEELGYISFYMVQNGGAYFQGESNVTGQYHRSSVGRGREYYGQGIVKYGSGRDVIYIHYDTTEPYYCNARVGSKDIGNTVEVFLQSDTLTYSPWLKTGDSGIIRACEIFSVNKSPMAIKQYFLSTSFLDSTALRFIPRSA